MRLEGEKGDEEEREVSEMGGREEGGWGGGREGRR